MSEERIPMSAEEIVTLIRDAAPDLESIEMQVVRQLDGWDVVVSGTDVGGIRERLMPIVEMLRERCELNEG